MIVEEMPEFPGGQEALQKYLAETFVIPLLLRKTVFRSCICQLRDKSKG